MTEFIDRMRDISANLKEQLSKMKTEANARKVSVEPFIQALGYDLSRLDEVVEEFTADVGIKQGEKVDYAIFSKGKPIILIEVKRAATKLPSECPSQLYRYYTATEAQFGIFTNGKKYQFYTDRVKSNLPDQQPFLTIDMLSLDNEKVAVLEGFAKSKFDPQGILSSVRKLDLQRLLDRERQDPSNELIAVFADRIYPKSKPLSRRERENFARLFKQTWREFWAAKTTPATPPAPAKPAPSPAPLNPPAPQPAPSGTAEIPVFAEYKGHPFEATLFFDAAKDSGRIQLKGRQDALAVSEAALAAIQSINPSYKSTNGWKFWLYKDPATGKTQLITELRKQIQKRPGASSKKPPTAPLNPPAPQPAPSGTAEIPIFGEYKGHPFQATLFFDAVKESRSRIKIEGREALPPSAAAREAINSVRATPIKGRNGWDFWFFHDDKTKQAQPISILRKTIHKRNR